MKLDASQCMVVKIGSSLLVDESKRCFNETWLASLIEDIHELRQKGTKIVLVSSGAVALGKLALKFTTKSLSLDCKQACAAVGQIQLVHTYQTLLNHYDLKAAQVLLTLEDTEDRKRYINSRNTLTKLLNMNIIPIINENDSVATAEIRYGDNDRLAARVAQMVDADTLVLLSDVDGLYNDDPRLNKNAQLIPVVETIDAEIMALAKDSSSNYGSGGMITKLDAAKIAMHSGCNMLITAGKIAHPLRAAMQTEKGTWFKSQVTLKRAKKSWLHEHLRASGTVVVDAGAEKALTKGSSLLPVGVKSVNGHFQKGAALDVVNLDKQIIARGLSNYDNEELQKILGLKSADIKSILNYEGCEEVIHRDNLVLLN